MTSFAIKGWLVGAARISGTFAKLSKSYLECRITTKLNGKEESFDGTRLMKWLAIFDEMEKNPRSFFQFWLDGEGEKELSIQMVSYLWNLNIADNMCMVILPNKPLTTALIDGSTSFEDDDLQYCLKDFS